jgi:hypothetical protein
MTTDMVTSFAFLGLPSAQICAIHMSLENSVMDSYCPIKTTWTVNPMAGGMFGFNGPMELLTRSQ